MRLAARQCGGITTSQADSNRLPQSTQSRKGESVSAPRVTLSTNIPLGGGRKAKKDLRDTARRGAEYHAERHIPKHFKPGAASLYGYARRTKRYQEFKRRVTGKTQPLVFTGQTQKEATDPGNRKITATSTRGAKLSFKISLKGISGRFRFKAGQRFLTEQQEQQLARKNELEAITASELDAIAKEEEQFYAQRANERTITRIVN